MSKEQKSILITGCSSGIGKALAKKYQKEGYLAIAGARRIDRMKDLTDLGVHTVALDVTSDESVKELKQKVETLTGGKLDILVNNAGQGCGLPALDTTVERNKQVFDVNLFGVMRMVNNFAPFLIRAKGKIVQIGSIAGVMMIPFGSTYAASKAALHAYSDVLRMELKAYDVEVITVVTGGVSTEIYDPTPLPEDSYFLEASYSVERRKKLSRENDPIPADVYAERVFNHVAKRNANPWYWEGSKVWMIRLASLLLPRWLQQLLMIRRVMLDKFIVSIRKKRASGELRI